MLKEILKKVRKLEFSTKNKIDSLFSGNYRSAFRGRGIEFADIRPYDSGDDVRDIDWKTSAKQGEIFVKTYHESRDNTLFFVIDGSASMQFSSRKEKKYESVLETFALLAFTAVQNGDKVGILFYGNGKEKIFPPKKGRKNILKILSFCIEAFQNPNFSEEKTDISKIFKKIFIFLRHSTSIFWFTGEVLNLNTLEKKSIKILKAKHDFIPIIFTDPLEENFSEIGLFNFQDSFSGEISNIILTPEVLKNYQKIRHVKKQKFSQFFTKIQSQILWIHSKEKIFQKLFLFFRSY